MTAPAALGRRWTPEPAERVAEPPDLEGEPAAPVAETRPPGPPEAVDGVLVDGVTARWGLHQLTESRARSLGVDLLRWPLAEPAAGWQQDAVCRGVDSSVADQLSEVLSQFAGTKLVSRWCSVCPVIRQCFETGRTTGGHGVWGGLALRDGRIAPWQTATERVRRAKDIVPNEDISTEIPTSPNEDISPNEAPNLCRRQRAQPRRRTRAQRHALGSVRGR